MYSPGDIASTGETVTMGNSRSKATVVITAFCAVGYAALLIVVSTLAITH